MAGKSAKQILRQDALLALVALIYLLIASTVDVPCPFKAIFHVPSPTCGMTRSFVALLQLDFSASLHYNPMTIPMILTLLFAFHRPLFTMKKKTSDAILIAAALLIFVVYIIRVLSGNIVY